MQQFHPSRGPLGSAVQMADGSVYIRTSQGFRKLDNFVGGFVARYQQRLHLLQSVRHRMMRWSVGLGGLAGAGVTWLWMR